MLLILWVVFALCFGLYASSNGRSFWVWFILALVVDPLIAWLIFMIVARGR